MIVSSLPQLALESCEVVGIPARVTAAPPAIETFLSLLSATNPTHWLSGEKKSALAPSVPGKLVEGPPAGRVNHLFPVGRKSQGSLGQRELFAGREREYRTNNRGSS